MLVFMCLHFQIRIMKRRALADAEMDNVEDKKVRIIKPFIIPQLSFFNDDYYYLLFSFHVRPQKIDQNQNGKKTTTLRCGIIMSVSREGRTQAVRVYGGEVGCERGREEVFNRDASPFRKKNEKRSHLRVSCMAFVFFVIIFFCQSAYCTHCIASSPLCTLHDKAFWLFRKYFFIIGKKVKQLKRRNTGQKGNLWISYRTCCFFTGQCPNRKYWDI